ncbi:hypothetical protein V5799_034509 [Amblyomma americanum]|uniref:Uncharacterized protein n=1 Tax=Amblyomma americanum TaxID=6943 RepID=A0AAQ4DK91_AMBAM
MYKAKGWRYSKVLDFFKEIENFNVPDVDPTEKKKYHGTQGETPVNYPSYHTPVSDAFLNACRESDYDHIDYNGEKHIGYSRVQANIWKWNSDGRKHMLS